MRFLEVLVFLFYVGWLVLSLIAQGETWANEKIKRWDVFSIIPNYHFFCPKPTMEDYHLYYRHQLNDGSWNEWTKAAVGGRNLWYCWIWNPGKRSRKVFQKAVKVIKKNKSNQKKRHGHIYRLLADYVINASPGDGFVAAQFKITSNQNLASDSIEVVVFLSKRHPIGLEGQKISQSIS